MANVGIEMSSTKTTAKIPWHDGIHMFYAERLERNPFSVLGELSIARTAAAAPVNRKLALALVGF
jgi:hypothetical protein